MVSLNKLVSVNGYGGLDCSSRQNRETNKQRQKSILALATTNFEYFTCYLSTLGVDQAKNNFNVRFEGGVYINKIEWPKEDCTINRIVYIYAWIRLKDTPIQEAELFHVLKLSRHTNIKFRDKTFTATNKRNCSGWTYCF